MINRINDEISQIYDRYLARNLLKLKDLLRNKVFSFRIESKEAKKLKKEKNKKSGKFDEPI